MHTQNDPNVIRHVYRSNKSPSRSSHPSDRPFNPAREAGFDVDLRHVESRRGPWTYVNCMRDELCPECHEYPIHEGSFVIAVDGGVFQQRPESGRGHEPVQACTVLRERVTLQQEFCAGRRNSEPDRPGGRAELSAAIRALELAPPPAGERLPDGQGLAPGRHQSRLGVFGGWHDGVDRQVATQRLPELRGAAGRQRRAFSADWTRW